MRMQRLCRLGLYALCIGSSPVLLAGPDADLDTFRVPAGADIPQDYRQTYEQVAGPLFSGMHWNHFIRVYSKHGTAAYRHNSQEFQRYYQSDEDWMEDLPEPDYRTYPVGSVIIKENFWEVDNQPGKAHALTIMVKRAAGFDPDHGDWEYIELDRKGVERLRGNARQSEVALRCANCHESVKDRDYIFAIESGK